MQAKRRLKTGAGSARRRISGDVWSCFVQQQGAKGALSCNVYFARLTQFGPDGACILR